jgi:hypothetical protein
MRPYPDSSACHAKKGLLFLRDCGDPAVDACSLCGRPVCHIHRIVDAQGVLCPECHGRDADDDDDDDMDEDAPDKSRVRNRYYDRFNYTPYYYGDSHYYSDRDYRTFDRQDQPTLPDQDTRASRTKESGTPAGSDDSNELDDFMES